MRYVNAPNVALALLATLAFLLVQAPRTTLGHPAAAVASAVISVAISAIEPLISGLISDMRTKRMSEEVTAKVWMHTGDHNQNGCGLYFQANGYSGGEAHDWFPKEKIHMCNGVKFNMRMTSQSAAYEKTLHLGNDQVSKFELHADGWTDTKVKSACFGMSANTIVGGPRAFCVTGRLLKACKDAKDTWGDINLDSDDINFTRSTRGIHKIIFRNIEQLVNAYEALGGNADDPSTADMICDNIDLVRGSDAESNNVCTAEWWRLETVGVYDQMLITYVWDRNDHNPYGCDRYTGSK